MVVGMQYAFGTKLEISLLNEIRLQVRNMIKPSGEEVKHVDELLKIALIPITQDVTVTNDE